MLQKKYILYFLVVLLFSSCAGNEVNVVIDNTSDTDSASSTNASKKVVIDDKLTMNIKSDSTTVVKLSLGNHTVQVDNQAKQTIFVDKKGGIINLGNIDYVVYEIEYNSQQSSTNNGGLKMPKYKSRNAVVIDSFIVEYNKGKRNLSDSTLMSIVEGTHKKTTLDVLSGGSSISLTKFGKGKFYIDRKWDYNMTDTIPETLQVRSSGFIGDNSTTRTAIMQATRFLLFAMLQKDEYVVRSISEVRKGTNDKKRQKEMEKKQMEF